MASRNLGTLTLDLIAKTSNFEQGMDRASRRTRSTTSEFERAAAAAQKLALAAGAAAAAVAASSAAIVMNAAKAMDATSKMAQQIGVTTEALTGMRFAAQQFSSISDQQFDQAMRRMTRRIEEAAAGGGAAKKALEEMGLSARALSQMTPDRQMLALADAMKRTESQANRLRYTMAIFDTEGMALVPALQQGAAAFEENIKLAERYGVVLSTEAARAAEEFNTNLSHLGSMLDGLKIQLASEVLPTINAFISNVIQATTEVGGLHSEVQSLSGNSAFKAWFEASLVGLARVADVAVFLAKAIGVVGGAFRSVAADAEVALAAINKAQAWNWFSDEATNELQAALAKRNQIVGGFNKELADLFTYQGNRFEQAALSAINTVRIQSDEVKLVDLTTRDLAESTSASTAATKRNSSALTEAQRAAQNFRREQDQSLRSQLQSVSAIHSQAQAIEDQVAVYGLGKTAIEDLTIARLEERAAMLRWFEGSEEAVEAIEREIEARQRLRTAIGSLEQKEAERQAWEDWSRDVEQIFDRVGQSLTDAIFDGGKSGKELLRDLFKGLTFNVLINPLMNQMQGWVTNQLGGMFGAQNPQQGGMLGTAQNLYSGYNAITGGLNSTLGNAAQWLGQKVGSQALQSFGLGLSGTTAATGIASLGPALGASMGTSMGATAASGFTASFTAGISGSASAAATGGAATLGSTLGAALPWVGGALALGSAFGLFDDRVPTTRRSKQGASRMLPDGTFEIAQYDSRQDAASQEAARDFAQAAVKHANDLFERIGVDAGIHSFQTLMESSILGDKQGVGSSGQVRIGDVIRDIGLTVEPSWTKHGFGGWSEAEMLPRLMTDVQLTILEAFQAAGDQLPSMLSGMLEGVDIRSLGAEQAQELAQRFQLVVDQVSAFQSALEQLPFASLRDLTFDVSAAMISALGGIESANAALSSYFDNFYSQEEKLDWLSQQISGSLAAVGLVMPDVTQGADAAKQAFRELFESIDPLAEGGAEAKAAMLGVNQQFHELVTGLDQLSEATRRAADEALAAARKEEERRQAAWAAVADRKVDEALAQLQAAYSTVQRFAQQEISRLQQTFSTTDSLWSAYQSRVRSLESELGNLLTTIGRGVADLRGQVEATARMQYNQARAVISTAVLTGQLPQSADLTEAMRIAQQGVANSRYASAFDEREAYLKLAAELEALQSIAQPELDAAQATLEQLEKQYNKLRGIESLSEKSLSQLERQLIVAFSAEEAARVQIVAIEAQLAWAERQYNALLGIDTSIDSLSAAMRAFSSAVSNVQQARKDAELVPGSKAWEDAYLKAKQAELEQGRHRPQDYTGRTVQDLRDYITAGHGMSVYEHYLRYGRNENIPGFDVGTSYVPHDMTANIHKGEIIIDPRSSDILRRYGIEVQGGGNKELVAEVRQLRAEVAGLRAENKAGQFAIAKYTQKAARIQEKWDAIGMPQEVSA